MLTLFPRAGKGLPRIGAANRYVRAYKRQKPLPRQRQRPRLYSRRTSDALSRLFTTPGEGSAPPLSVFRRLPLIAHAGVHRQIAVVLLAVFRQHVHKRAQRRRRLPIDPEAKIGTGGTEIPVKAGAVDRDLFIARKLVPQSGLDVPLLELLVLGTERLSQHHARASDHAIGTGAVNPHAVREAVIGAGDMEVRELQLRFDEPGAVLGLRPGELMAAFHRRSEAVEREFPGDAGAVGHREVQILGVMDIAQHQIDVGIVGREIGRIEMSAVGLGIRLRVPGRERGGDPAVINAAEAKPTRERSIGSGKAPGVCILMGVPYERPALRSVCQNYRQANASYGRRETRLQY